MGLSVAVLTRGGFGNTFADRLAVIALEVDVGFDAVTLAAAYGLVRLGVWQIRDVCVATRAEIFSVD